MSISNFGIDEFNASFFYETAIINGFLVVLKWELPQNAILCDYRLNKIRSYWILVSGKQETNHLGGLTAVGPKQMFPHLSQGESI
jgi:hypothetical protein